MVGGHWAFLQAVAWSGMLVKYSAASGLWVGLQQTFDGEHPCPLCCAIKKAQGQGSAAENLTPAQPETRLLATSTLSGRIDRTPAPAWRHATAHVHHPERALDPPPLPPPRSALLHA